MPARSEKERNQDYRARIKATLGLPSADTTERARLANERRKEHDKAYRERRKAAGYKRHNGSAASQQSYRMRDRIAPEFIAYDGEGVTEDGVHKYILFMCSDGEYLYNPHGLSTRAVLSFLLERFQAHPTAAHVCYGASYDVNMMLCDLTRRELEILYKGYPGQRADFPMLPLPDYGVGINYLQRKWLKMRDLVTRKTYFLYDVIGFFQYPFVHAIEEYLGKEYPDYAMIKENKAKRGEFVQEDIETIKHYCRAELTALVKIMDKLAEYLAEAGIYPKKWHGTGAIASELLRRENVKQHMERTPEHVNDAACSAYFGGRIECLRYGYDSGPIYQHDINSAYPAATVELPTLRGGTWLTDCLCAGREHGYSLHKVRWSAPDGAEFYPLPYRIPTGNILFPQEGRGWYWQPEIALLSEYQLRYPPFTYEIEESLCFQPCTDEKPFAFIADLYETRRRWKAEGNAAQLALKLAINSVYGKLIQHVGGRNGQPPTFHQIEWGGYITSWTRAKLLVLALQNPASVVCFATDGIYSTDPLCVDEGKGLGAWGVEQHKEMLIVQSGVYFLHKNATKEQPEKWIDYYRGFDAGTLDRTGILEAWQSGQLTYTARSTRFVTLGQAIENKNLFPYWRQWRSVDRDLSLVPDGKRIGNPFANPYAGLVRTTAFPALIPEMPSMPYPLPWKGQENPYRDTLIDGVPYSVYTADHSEE